MTSLPGVFAGGDIVRGATLVVWGVRDGRDVAEQASTPISPPAGAAAERCRRWPWPREGRTT